MKAMIKSTGKVVEVMSRFMPKKKNSPSRDWMCNLSDGTCIDEKELEYINDKPVADGIDDAAWDCVLDSVDVNNPHLLPKYKELLMFLFIAGAKWQADHTPLPEDTVLFNKGVAEGKRLMMEGAVEGDFMLNPYPIICLDDCKNYDFKEGDKVKLIICKED